MADTCVSVHGHVLAPRREPRGEDERGARGRRCGEGEGCGRALPGDTRGKVGTHPANTFRFIEKRFAGLPNARTPEGFTFTERLTTRQ